MTQFEDYALRYRESEVINAWEQARRPFLRMATTIYGCATPSWLLHLDGTITQANDGLTPELRKQIEAIRLTLTDINERRDRQLAELYQVFRVPGYTPPHQIAARAEPQT